ncbi:unnamed protein product [Adineta ricciae]|uniref:Nuclear protein MDM1 n=1 Tax=Adineta ricciae TaxID=249248 RepID=A0A816D8N7_ADIRI|nr:unnamed protein product [Adineta ricciae]
MDFFRIMLTWQRNCTWRKKEWRANEKRTAYSDSFYRKMKYQTEYQRNFQRRTPLPVDDYTKQERKLVDVPPKRSSSLSPPRRRANSSPNRNNHLAVIGPNEKFSHSYLYRMRQPVQDNARVAKPREYALLGRNEKFQDNAVYPLRKPVVDKSPRIPVDRHKSANHTCGSQTDLKQAPFVSFDPQYGRETVPVRNRIGAQSEYQQQYLWKQPLGDLISDQMLVEDAKVRDRRSDPVLPLTVIDPSEKILIEKTSALANPSPPPRVNFEIDRARQQLNNRPIPDGPAPASQANKNPISEYQARYKLINAEKKPRTRKAFEAEQAEERKRKEIARAEHAYTDDEGAGGDVQFGKEFRQKHPHGNLRRWKSEYQATYKPFWRFDYKNGKWYKDAETEETGFNPNLFWYKELKSSRKRADEYRTNAETDHFNRNHTLQLQTGQGGNKNYFAWDANNDDDADSVISIDRDLERERQRDQEAKRRVDEQIQSKIHYQQSQSEKPIATKPNQVAQTDHQVDRVVYIDDPIPKAPSLATKAFVRNLNSSSVQQHMLWDSESLCSQRTDSDLEFKSNTARELHRKHYMNDDSNVIRKVRSSKTQENRSTNTHSPLADDYSSSQTNERAAQDEKYIRPSTSSQEQRHAAGRSSYDTHILNRRPPSRPHTSVNNYRSYKSEATDYNNNDTYNHDSTPKSNCSFENHLNRLDERFGQTYNARTKDDDVLSVHSARSLSSSCSLASQTLERAQQNMNKYWGGHSSASVDLSKKS